MSAWWWLLVTETSSKLYIVEYIVAFWLNDFLVSTTTQRDSSYKYFNETCSEYHATLLLYCGLVYVYLSNQRTLESLILRLAVTKLFRRIERRTDMTRLIFALFNCFKKVETSKRNMVKCKVKQITVVYVHLSSYILNSFLKWDCRTYRNANTQFMHSHVAKLTSRCYRRSDRHVGKQDAVNFQFILGEKR